MIAAFCLVGWAAGHNVSLGGVGKRGGGWEPHRNVIVRPPVAGVVLLVLSPLFLSPFPQCACANWGDGVLLGGVLLGCADDMGPKS